MIYKESGIHGDGVDGVVDDAVQHQAVLVRDTRGLFVHVDVDPVDEVSPQEPRLFLEIPSPGINGLPLQPPG